MNAMVEEEKEKNEKSSLDTRPGKAVCDEENRKGVKESLNEI